MYIHPVQETYMHVPDGVNQKGIPVTDPFRPEYNQAPPPYPPFPPPVNPQQGPGYPPPFTVQPGPPPGFAPPPQKRPSAPIGSSAVGFVKKLTNTVNMKSAFYVAAAIAVVSTAFALLFGDSRMVAVAFVSGIIAAFAWAKDTVSKQSDDYSAEAPQPYYAPAPQYGAPPQYVPVPQPQPQYGAPPQPQPQTAPFPGPVVRPNTAPQPVSPTSPPGGQFINPAAPVTTPQDDWNTNPQPLQAQTPGNLNPPYTVNAAESTAVIGQVNETSGVPDYIAPQVTPDGLPLYPNVVRESDPANDTEL